MIPFAVRIVVVPAIALVAAGIAAFVYFRPLDKPQVSATAPTLSQPASPQSAPQAAPTINPPQSTAALAPSAPAAPSTSATPATKPPEFDIVRVTPSGETVVAGRAPGAARVELLDQGKVIAGEKVDSSGQFVLLPPALAGGDHLLALRITPEGQTPVSSTQSVAVAVRSGGSPVVTLAEPGKPSVVLAAPEPAPPQKPAEAATPASAQVTIRTAEVETGGRFFATGTAPPGSAVRLYLNGSHVADAATTSDGKWSLTITKGVGGGKYTLRADAVGGQGKVVSRAEVPFEAPMAAAAAAPAPSSVAPAVPPQSTASLGAQSPRAAAKPSPVVVAGGPPAPETSAAAAPQAAVAPAPSQAPAVPQPHSAISVAANNPTANPTANPIVPEIATATVTRGDSLWRISRLRWGKGMRYTVIYEANASQIRNPDLIYPGQILVMPQN